MVTADRRAPKRIGAETPPSYDAAPISLDDVIEARVAGYVGAMVKPLQAEIEDLRTELQSIDPERWPMLMSPQDAAAYLGIAPGTLKRLVNYGLIEAVNPPGLLQRHYNRESLDAWRLSQ